MFHCILIFTFHDAKYFKTQIRKDEMEAEKEAENGDEMEGPNNEKSLLYDILNKCIYTNDLSNMKIIKTKSKVI